MKRIKELEKKLLHYKSLYYQGKPEVSDFEYDELEEELRKIDPKNTIFNIVGSDLSNNKIAHKTKMLSLEKTYDVDNLKKWIGEEKVISVFKIDGSSCSLVYKKGRLTIAKTRGNGSFGEDITTKILFIDDIPKSIESFDCEIRGEIYCTQENFIKINNELERRNLPLASSQRNIVAGLLGRKENIDLAKFLSFQAFELISEKELNFETEKFDFLNKNNFPYPEYHFHEKLDDLEKRLNETKQFLEKGNYLIDGIVFIYNRIELHSELGETSHHPKYKMAFKFRGESKNTKINSITWQVSRNGILTPVAEVEPVELSGALISRVTLHNYGVVKSFQLKKNDEINIERSGEVIPKFISLVKTSDEKYSIPSHCPSCDTSLREEDIRLICDHDSCPAKVLESLKHFIKSVSIDDLSTARLNEMLEKKLIKNIPDIYDLTEEVLIENLSATKEKMAKKIVTNIQKSKEIELKMFLTSLGLSGGGVNKCEKIIEAGFDNLEKIKNIKMEELIEILQRNQHAIL